MYNEEISENLYSRCKQKVNKHNKFGPLYCHYNLVSCQSKTNYQFGPFEALKLQLTLIPKIVLKSFVVLITTIHEEIGGNCYIFFGLLFSLLQLFLFFRSHEICKEKNNSKDNLRRRGFVNKPVQVGLLQNLEMLPRLLPFLTISFSKASFFYPFVRLPSRK
jgi:hypothetical protein